MFSGLFATAVDLLRPLGARPGDGIARGMDLDLRTGLGGNGSRSEHSRPTARHRIEHAGLVRPDQLPGSLPSTQRPSWRPNFLWYLGDDYAEITDRTATGQRPTGSPTSRSS